MAPQTERGAHRRETLYPERPGPGGTDAVVEAAVRRAKELGVAHVVVATTEGDTALKLARAVSGQEVRVVAVTHHAGARGGDEVALKDEAREELARAGHRIVTASHALSGVERSITRKLGGVSRVEVVAQTLKLFGCDGIKVAVEVAVMAADAGAIPTDREVVAVGGSGRGADAAVVLKAAHMNSFFDLEIREIIAKARQRS